MTSDSALLAQLREMFDRVDPVPEHLSAAAEATLSWRDPDAALAELVADTLTAPAGVRSAAGPRLLTFEAPGLTVEVEVAEFDDARRIVGQVVPPQPGQVEVRWTGGSVRVPADGLGRFVAEPVPAGPVSLACRLGSKARPIVTSWLTV